MLTRSATRYGIRLELNGSFLFRLRKICNAYSRDNSLLEERHFGGGKGSNPFYFLPYTGDERRKYGNNITNLEDSFSGYSNFSRGIFSGKVGKS